MVPALSVDVTPKQAMVAVGRTGHVPITVRRVEPPSARPAGAAASLEAPVGWRRSPRRVLQVAVRRRTHASFTVTAPVDGAGRHPITAAVTPTAARIGGYNVIDHRDLETRLSIVHRHVVRGIDVRIAPNLRSAT